MASATGRKLRTLLRAASAHGEEDAADRRIEVAAMPAPAPAATRMMRCRGRHAQQLSERRPERRADLNDRPLAADRAPLPIAIAEASDLTTATIGRMTPPP